MVPKTVTDTLDPRLALSADFAEVVRRHVDGFADDADIELLQANSRLWIRALYRCLDDVAESIEHVRATVRGSQRAVIVADLEGDYRAIDDVLERLVGPAQKPKPADSDNGAEPAAGPVELQLSWVPGRVIAWAGGPGRSAESSPDVLRRLRDSGAGTVDWSLHRPVKLPGGGKAATVSAPIESCLGWLIALSEPADGEGIGVSVSWLASVAAFAARLAAQGRMVPQLKKMRRRPRVEAKTAAEDGSESPRGRVGRGEGAPYVVRWSPALVSSEELTALSDSLPGAAAAFESQRDASNFTLAVLADIVHAIVAEAAERVDMPAAPQSVHSRVDMAEAALARLDGEPFESISRYGSDFMRRLEAWARPVTELYEERLRLVVQLSPPDEIGAWHLAVLSESSAGDLQPVERALVSASRTRKQAVKHHLARLERLIPDLLRLGGRRRGEVILSDDEAWKLMTEVGPVLQAAGYEVRVPRLSRRRPLPMLRLTSLESQESVVGARQLAEVRWSVAFDDVELTAAQIRDLAARARPLVRSRGQWVEVDRADLQEAAAALAERAEVTRMTGADMLRHALGLEGSPLTGGTALVGDGWAADLIRSARRIPEELPFEPEGFKGRLRAYQADALTWLSFLEQAGLGGCLALDMGLGKTPTMLAHINLTRRHGPSLVVAPTAVVGNWALEARRFTPTLRVAVHHGPSRCPPDRMPALARKTDLVVSTYGTAVRDMDALEKIEWSTIVLDEAQAVKNPASETAQQLRKLQSRCRVTLTGTPIENGLGDLWAIMDFCNPGLLGARLPFISEMSKLSKRAEPASADSARAEPEDADAARAQTAAATEGALAALNGILVFRRTKAEPVIAAELPDRIDELDHCTMTAEQIGLYQAVLDDLVARSSAQSTAGTAERKGAVLAAITALKQICNHPVSYQDDGGGLEGRSGKLARLHQLIDQVFAAGERMLIFTHFATWGERLARHLSERSELPIDCYHGGLARGARDRMIASFQRGRGAGALVLSLKAGGTGLNLTAANHVVLYDRWWNPAVEDQARDRAWRIGQRNTVVCHRLVCPGTVDERVEEVVAGKRRIADMVLPKSSSVGDLDGEQLQAALGIDADSLLVEDGGYNGNGRSGRPGPGGGSDQRAPSR